MKIGDLFELDIYRKIEEVVKVEQADEETVFTELMEYIVTDTIKEHLIKVLRAYAEAPSEPSEGIGVWISGFFGSGKSSFAKILGYLLENRQVCGKKVMEIFKKQVNNPQISELLTYIEARIPTKAIIFDISMDRGVRVANERMTEIMYKVLLRNLGYAEDFDLADLEISLETDNRLQAFEEKYQELYGNPWSERRWRGQAINEASRVLHELEPETYPHADSWVQSLRRGDGIGRADITPNLLAERAFELMKRQQPGKALIFVIDEVGQYVSRSVDKMLDLQAIIQAFGIEGKNRTKKGEAIAPTWIVVTAQEKLSEVVDALDDKKIELARLQDRFPIRIDLASADIAEITGKRVLRKKPEAERLLGEMFDKYADRLNTFASLERTSRQSQVTKKAFVDLYPYLPSYIDLSVEIMSGIRLQAGGQRHIGGSNRTIIKQAQEMLIGTRTGLTQEKVGKLVTLDKVYDLVEGNLSTEKRKDIQDIAVAFPEQPFLLRVAKALRMLEFVRNIPRTARNIAAVLYDDLGKQWDLDQVTQALEILEKENYIRQTEEGYKLQTIQEKDWESTRRGLAPKQSDLNRLIKETIRGILDKPMITCRYKDLATFRLDISLNDERISEAGEVPVNLLLADDYESEAEILQTARKLSREKEQQVFWVVILNDSIRQVVREVYRSERMIAEHERNAATGKLTAEETACLNEEKIRLQRYTGRLRTQIQETIINGYILFRGNSKDASGLGTDLTGVVKGIIEWVVPYLYPKLEIGARKLSGKEAETLLTAVNLNGLPIVFYGEEGGLGLVIKEDGKYIPNINAPIAQEVLSFICRRHDYNQPITGKDLENHFTGLIYGWDLDMIRLVLALLFRAGAIEVISQGRRFRDYKEPAARQPFISNSDFRKASFNPREVLDLHTLAEAVRQYEALTGEMVEVDETAVAEAFKRIVRTDREVLISVYAELKANNLPGQELIKEYLEFINNAKDAASDDIVRILTSEGGKYKEWREELRKLRDGIEPGRIELIKKARLALTEKLPALLSTSSCPEEVEKAGGELRSNLEAETFYERFNRIIAGEEKISRYYAEVYHGLHEERNNRYRWALDEVKGRREWTEIPPEERDRLLTPLSSRICAGIIGNEVFCPQCRASLSQMQSDLVAVDILMRQILRLMQELLEPQEQVQRLRIDAFYPAVIESIEEYDQATERLRTEIVKLVQAGIKVILE
jgi:hypothetical protein